MCNQQIHAGKKYKIRNNIVFLDTLNEHECAVLKYLANSERANKWVKSQE